MATQKTKPSTAKKTTSPTLKASPAKKASKSVVKVSSKATPVKSSPTPTKVAASPAKTQTSSTTSKSTLSSYRSSATATMKRLNIRPMHAILAIIVLLIVGLLIYFRGFFVVATVNGKPIDRLTYMKEVEGIYVSEARTTAGKQAMNQLVTKTLLHQEAEKKNVSVTEKEINDEVAKTRKSLEGQGQNLESALAMQGDTLANYKERIQLQKLLEKLVGEIKVSDKEITDYVEKNKESIPAGTKDADIKAQAKEALRQEKFNTQVQTLIQNLQKNAKISYPKA
ncbi:MAG: SurA N-terminal domain-containing protein [Candidatus Levybacteria bacterium]|nr:SurA N-terminal domain-containing protein [Candidatus Levybacteria bacterium]